MLNTSILNDTLKDFTYYLRKLPKFLLQSEGFTSHFRIWYDILVGQKDELNNTGVVGVADTLFNTLNIFDVEKDSVDNSIIKDNYLEYINSRPDSEDGTKSDVLDKIAALFGVSRSFEVTYEVSGGIERRFVNLNNADFLLFIRTQIIKNYCDGSYYQIKDYYNSVGLRVYVTTAAPAESNVYLVYFNKETAYTPSEDVQTLFLAGLLTIKSMGISYRHGFVNLDNVLIWNVDADGDNTVQDDFGWGDNITYAGGLWLI